MCNVREWGHLCAASAPLKVKVQNIERAADRVARSGEAALKAFEALKPPPPATIDTIAKFAAPGQCPHCDRRRAADAERQRKHREKHAATAPGNRGCK